MKLGIVGLPNVGKSTLFNSLTKAGAESANYPFCTIDPNVGVVTVPDHRLDVLGEMYNTKKITPAAIEFVDIAGLVKGASKGEGLGNQFLANIREVDAIVHVVRCFEDENVVHVDGSIDPLRDIETINLELVFSDLEILERRIAKTTKSARMDKDAAKELEFLKVVKAHLEDGKPAATLELEDEDQELYMKEYNLLTWKPVIYAANVSEDDLADDGASNPHVQKVREYASQTGSEVFALCAEIEQEISELEEDEKKEFLEDLGIKQSGLEKLIVASYRQSGGCELSGPSGLRFLRRSQRKRSCAHGRKRVRGAGRRCDFIPLQRIRRVPMTQSELKEKIEEVRKTLDTAIETKAGFGKILDISQSLDRLIEEYMQMNTQSCMVKQ